MLINIGQCIETPLFHKFLYVSNASENVDIVKEWLKIQFGLNFIKDLTRKLPALAGDESFLIDRN